ncbi:MAG: hypothetical protein A2Y64_00730 [Candidatus Coatesbacteria bacterium RBG_13_66_14]|uniref:SGNH/GDSL hydrolase family protein n=1 Tax=Candidatus Coatesbacteria bacterium RBG_13_66_14 TaxID=1817816 RepID=A0A1F5F4V4_9BACT|nr:MAG: hypothetical protein A2Y64_00730 [Candidatus Coatesbacteria bacterium RBG_13_66_14]
MLRLLFRFLIFLVPVALLLVLGYVVDPLDRFPGPQPVPPVTAHYRHVKTLDYLHSDRGFDAFILGSSRVMRLEPTIVDEYGYKAYNYGYNMTRAEDLYCTLRFLLDENRTPIRLLVVGLEVEMLHDSFPVHPETLQTPELARYLRNDIELPRLSSEDILQLASDSVRLSFSSLYYLLTGREPGGEYELDPATGEYVVKPPRAGTVKISANLMRTMYNMFSDFDALNPGRMAYFDAFIDLCRENGIRVIAFVTANHPVLEEFLVENTQYPERLADAKMYWDFLGYDGFAYVDLSRPEYFGGDPEDFTDLAHIGTYNSELVARLLMETCATAGNISPDP